VGLFFEGGILGIVGTSKKKGNIFSQIPCFLRGKKCQFFEEKIPLGAKTLPHFQ